MGLLDRSLTDGAVSVRPFDLDDQAAVVAGRDAEVERFLGPGSAEPAPVGCIVVAGDVVGWIDVDDHRSWLGSWQVNVGYVVFAEHRGLGYGTRALALVSDFLGQLDPPLEPTLLIDPDNSPSLAMAARAGFEQAGAVDGQLLFRQP